MTRLLSLVFSLFLLFAFVPDGVAKKVNTKVKPPVADFSRKARKQGSPQRDGESYEKIAEQLTFMAYDKRASADKETFFVDNGSALNLANIEVEISYFSESGKQIHRQKVELEGPFPARQTRKVDIRSWDTQKSFHYAKSAASKNGSTPYTVRFKVLSFIKSSE